MNISIDFDDTYTKDPIFWDTFCLNAFRSGHSVYCVSARPEAHMDKVRETVGKIIGSNKCFGTGLKPKREWMRVNTNISIDVWIDDTPEAIVSDHYSKLILK